MRPPAQQTQDHDDDDYGGQMLAQLPTPVRARPPTRAVVQTACIAAQRQVDFGELGQVEAGSPVDITNAEWANSPACAYEEEDESAALAAMAMGESILFALGCRACMCACIRP